jgi:hypothetical protein
MSKKSSNTIIFNTVQRTVDTQTELKLSLTKTNNIKANTVKKSSVTVILSNFKRMPEK